MDRLTLDDVSLHKLSTSADWKPGGAVGGDTGGRYRFVGHPEP
jgi:hypothetical protein